MVPLPLPPPLHTCVSCVASLRAFLCTPTLSHACGACAHTHTHTHTHAQVTAATVAVSEDTICLGLSPVVLHHVSRSPHHFPMGPCSLAPVFGGRVWGVSLPAALLSLTLSLLRCCPRMLAVCLGLVRWEWWAGVWVGGRGVGVGGGLGLLSQHPACPCPRCPPTHSPPSPTPPHPVLSTPCLAPVVRGAVGLGV